MVETSAYDLLKKHNLHHVLHIFGLEDVAKTTKVKIESTKNGHNYRNWVKNSLYVDKNTLSDPKKLVTRIVQELMKYQTGGSVPSAFYTSSYVRSLLEKQKIDYRELMREEESKKEREIPKTVAPFIVGIPSVSAALGLSGLIPKDIAAGIAGISALFGFQLAMTGLGGLSEMYHDPEEKAKIRYLRWLIKRGVKKGIKPSKEDAREFVKDREWELNLREGLTKEKLQYMSPASIATVLPYLQGEMRKIAEERLKEALLKALKDMRSKNPIKRWRATRRYRNLILIGAVRIPENFFETKFYKKRSEQKASNWTNGS